MIPENPTERRHLLSDASLCLHCTKFKPLSASNCPKVELLADSAAVQKVQITIDRCAGFQVKTV